MFDVKEKQKCGALIKGNGVNPDSLCQNDKPCWLHKDSTDPYEP